MKNRNLEVEAQESADLVHISCNKRYSGDFREQAGLCISKEFKEGAEMLRGRISFKVLGIYPW